MNHTSWRVHRRNTRIRLSVVVVATAAAVVTLLLLFNIHARAARVGYTCDNRAPSTGPNRGQRSTDNTRWVPLHRIIYLKYILRFRLIFFEKKKNKPFILYYCIDDLFAHYFRSDYIGNDYRRTTVTPFCVGIFIETRVIAVYHDRISPISRYHYGYYRFFFFVLWPTIVIRRYGPMYWYTGTTKTANACAPIHRR